MSEAKPDSVSGLGFKDKDKALETIKNLDGRDPDYQKLAIKGLIGRAKRVLTLTKDKDKLQNINDAMDIFNNWLKNYDKNNLAKENCAYIPLATINTCLPLKDKFNINSKTCESFMKAYEKVNGEYKNLRTVPSDVDKPTWDIIRNQELKKLLSNIDEEQNEWWDDILPTKTHMELILWAYSPEAAKLKKNVSKIKVELESVVTSNEDKSESDNTENSKAKKRKADDSSSASSTDEDSPKKKKNE